MFLSKTNYTKEIFIILEMNHLELLNINVHLLGQKLLEVNFYLYLLEQKLLVKRKLKLSIILNTHADAVVEDLTQITTHTFDNDNRTANLN